ncbi:hypothetical protein C6W26_08065 [Bacillus halotolerans]|nr:hypothetical protein C6W26_08065 [Bacillus halotolerans]
MLLTLSMLIKFQNQVNIHASFWIELLWKVISKVKGTQIITLTKLHILSIKSTKKDTFKGI